MANYVTQITHLVNGNSFEYVNYDRVYQFLLDIICQAYYNKA